MEKHISRDTLLYELQEEITSGRRLASQNDYDFTKYFYDILVYNGFKQKDVSTYFLSTVMYSVYLSRSHTFDTSNETLNSNFKIVYEDRLGYYKPYNLDDEKATIYTAISNNFALYKPFLVEKIFAAARSLGIESLNDFVSKWVGDSITNFEKYNRRRKFSCN